MRRLDGITHKTLADALKRLERNGLVRREVLPTSPVGVEYMITLLGKSLQRPFTALYDWALTHGLEMEKAQGEYDDGRASDWGGGLLGRLQRSMTDVGFGAARARLR